MQSSPRESSLGLRVPRSAERRSGPPEPLPSSIVDDVIRRALDEDLRTGDLTSESAVPEAARAHARLVAKQHGRIAGLAVFGRVFQLCDSTCEVELVAADGDACEPRQELARVHGNARALLAAERTALNLLQRMSGVATQTARFVELCEGRARVLDTRKTNPTLRAFDKFAVRCGGGENHRTGLYDEVMLKENHIELAGQPLAAVLRQVRETVGDTRITCEARDETEARTAVEGGADVVLLDNMTPEILTALVPQLRELARSTGNDVELEASGGVNEDTIAEFSKTGVDRISVGGLTHSAPALDLSLYLEPAS